MYKLYVKLALISLLSFCFFLQHQTSFAALVKGIYVTQTSLENTTFLNYLIKNAKAVGINTFIIDMEKPRKQYLKGINIVKAHNIKYVARVVVFPDGGTADQVRNQAYWEKRFELVAAAVAYGAEEIQLDYIRYNTKQPPSPQNAKDVFKVVRWFKDKLAPHKIPLQLDVFGIASFGQSRWIGQDIKLFAEAVDVLCPMVYPSHFEPFKHHAVTPYQTIYDALIALKQQVNNKVAFRLYPFIEISNYRYPLSEDKRLAYIRAQIKAVEDGGGDGWYVWSANNKYKKLFEILSKYPVK